MANKYWSGNQRATAQSYAFSVTAVTAADTLTATINSKVETYVIPTGATVSSAAAGLVAALQATLILELKNFTYAVDGAAITAVGPVDGMPVTVSFAATGTSTLSSITTVSATSPNDASDTANWTGGTPGNGDTAIFENNSVSCLYNLDTLTSNTVAVVRRQSHTGQIGLADTNPLGYPEYLPTHFETAGTTLTVEDNSQAFVRIKSTAGSAVTSTVTGPQGGTVGREMIEITGTPASSVLNQNGGALAYSPLTSQSSSIATVRAANGVLRTGPSCALTNATLIGMQAEIGGNYTTLVVDRESVVTVTRAATAATSTTVESGTLNWGSTGGPNTTTVGSGGTLDFSLAPATVTPGTITLEEGSTLLDPNERLVKTFNLVISGELSNITMDLGTRFNLAVS